MFLIPLQQLPAGQTAQIDQIFGQPDEVHRLEELGLRQGVIIEMVRCGSPCILKFHDLKLCFREADLFNVLVRPEGSTQ